ncbi:hypothetical protein [Asticcacaulis excentricus]|uniref:hypothetical protein n=1 Tax=Asticcacaulis excentricus TaxID=78587 RepID=UPI000F846905|nr:hypothetical protein [Asticcacaulis excentricus]
MLAGPANAQGLLKCAFAPCNADEMTERASAFLPRMDDPKFVELFPQAVSDYERVLRADNWSNKDIANALRYVAYNYQQALKDRRMNVQGFTAETAKGAIAVLSARADWLDPSNDR